MVGEVWGVFEERYRYDQNTLYETIKEVIKMLFKKSVLATSTA